MNPLSPFTYYRRHKGQAILLLALIGSLTLGVYAMVSLVDTMLDNIRYTAHHLSRMSRLSTGGTQSVAFPGWASDSGALDSDVAAQIAAQMRAHPDVATVIPENGLYIGTPMGAAIPYPVMGVTEDDLPVVMNACDLRLKQGRLIDPRVGEIILSEELARALELDVGDRISYDINAEYYQTIATELTLVGILESVPSDAGPEVRAGFVSYEYLEAHERYQPRAVNWLIVPHPGRRMAVNDFASSLIAESTSAASEQLQTFESEMGFLEQGQQLTNTLYGLVDGVVAVAAALVVGMVHRIAVTHRLPELGLLHATGYGKRSLVRRLVLEAAVIACGGWAAGLLCARVVLVLLGATFFAARGLSTNLADAGSFLHTLPIPLIVIGWIGVSVSRTLNRLDSVAIIERGKLSMEQDRRSGQSRSTTTSHNPLSSWVFFLRHRRRSIFLLAAVGLMVLGVALPGFLTAAVGDSALPYFLGYASHSAVISPGYTYHTVAPDVVAQIRAHPAVAHAVPAKPLSMAFNSPLVGGSLSVYAVREQDLPALLNAFGLRLGEGELVQPRSAHIVLTSALARNRGLSVGSAIGHPVYERDGMPTELTVVGLLESTDLTLVNRAGYDLPPMPCWVGFASYEYVDGHERYAGTPTHLLVVPVEGRESEMEAWLEETIASPRVRVATLGTSYRLWRQSVQTGQMTITLSVTLLTAASALGLAILNVIFFNQRRTEFGVLHAVGHSRAGLIVRALRKSVSTTFAAWVIGAVCVLMLLLGTQAFVFEPMGMSLDLTNVAPWLFTLPIPVAVVTASAGTIAWALSRLDPVAVIERR